MAKSKYNKKFEEEITLFIAKANKNMDEVRTLAVLQLFNNITDDTPLWVEGSPLRGQVKWNWRLSIGSFPTNVLKGTDITGKQTKDRAYAQLRKYSGSEDIYISNSHPAIMSLEYGRYPSPSKSGRTVGGFSTQAPAGIARVNVLAWNTIVPMVAKQVNR